MISLPNVDIFFWSDFVLFLELLFLCYPYIHATFEIMSPFNVYITRRNVKNIMVGHFERYSFLFFLPSWNLFEIYIFVGHAICTTKNIKFFTNLFLTWFGFSFACQYAGMSSTRKSKSILLIGEYLNKSFGEKFRKLNKVANVFFFWLVVLKNVLLQKQIFLSCCYNLQEHWDDRRFKTVKISLWKITMKCFVRH